MAARSQKGYALITTTACMVVLIGCLGMSMDPGYLFLIKLRTQVAADAAALGGAHEVLLNNLSQVETAARFDASLNGFTDGTGGVTVTVNRPPASGPRQGEASSVEAIVAKSYPTYFMRLFGITSVTVRARAVARLGNGAGCIYALDPSASNALVASGSSQIAAQCGIYVNSSNAAALVTSGSSCVTGTSINVVGNYTNSSSCGPSPTPTTGAAAVSDPLANLPAPAVGACNHTNYLLDGATATINPGVYCGGIEVKGGGTLALNPGLYILNGGGLKVSSSTLRGTGVTFYNTEGAASYKGFDASGGSTVQLSAPTTGTYAGIIFYQDRTIVSGDKNSISGGSGTSFEGTLYFPTTELVYSGGSGGSAQYTILVARKINFSGSSTLNSDYSTLTGGSPIKEGVALAE